MWKRFIKKLTSGTQPRPASNRVSGRTDFGIYRVRSPGGFRDVVSLVPHEVAFQWGLASQAIVAFGPLLDEDSDRTTIADFQPNQPFVDLLHDVIATNAPNDPELRAEAYRLHTGWVYVIDARTPVPDGEVPPFDIFGAFKVEDCALVPNSYRPNPNHRLFSSDELFKLGESLQEKLMKRLIWCETHSPPALPRNGLAAKS